MVSQRLSSATVHATALRSSATSPMRGTSHTPPRAHAIHGAFGLAERTVQTAKRILDKTKAENKDPYLALLEYRNAPVDNLQSPAQLLMSRRLRSILPMTGKQLQPRVALQTAVHERREACQHRQQTYYNRTTRPLSHLPVGTPIRFRQEDGSWRPATVTQHADTHRNYYIQTRDGQTLRRNRWHLRESRETSHTDNTQNTNTHASHTLPSHADNTQHTNTHVRRIQPPHPELENHIQPESQPQQQQPGYTTRSGRIIRPRQVLDL